MLSQNVILVCASKSSQRLFGRSTLLGRSLGHFPDGLRPRLLLYPDNFGENLRGLPEIYNQCLRKASNDDLLVFIHDDAWIHDWNFCFTISMALSQYDIVGIVGSKGGINNRPGWWHYLKDNKPCRDNSAITSGSINHFDYISTSPCVYGEAPASCDLLDGVLIASKAGTLRAADVHFDTRFSFHCYDTDFCYTAKRKGLSIGTWPIAITHGSGGCFDKQWMQAADILMAKLGKHAKHIE